MPDAAARLRAALLAAVLACAAPANAQDWPARPLRLVVPVAAGGQPDVIARVLAPGLSQRLGQPVVVENRPGAQTNIAMESVARAAPDGYTLLLALTSLVINPHLQALSFDPLRDLAPVTLIARTQFVLSASPALPVATVAELLALARSRPGGLRCAHAGGATQVACALLGVLGNVAITPVPYRGNALVQGDLARGDVDILFENIGDGIEPRVRAGQLRPLAVTDPTLGSEPMPPLPKLADSLPGFEITSWQGIVAPAGTPPPVLRKLAAEIRVAMGTPAVSRRLGTRSGDAALATPDEFGEFLRREYARYARMVRQTGLRAE